MKEGGFSRSINLLTCLSCFCRGIFFFSFQENLSRIILFLNKMESRSKVSALVLAMQWVRSWGAVTKTLQQCPLFLCPSRLTKNRQISSSSYPNIYGSHYPNIIFGKVTLEFRLEIKIYLRSLWHHSTFCRHLKIFNTSQN